MALPIFDMPRKLAGGIVRHKRIVLAVIAVGVLILIGPWVYATVSTDGQRYDSTKVTASAVPRERVAVVFGARVNGDDPTPYLRFRVQAATDLYKAGRVQKLLMTGDNSLKSYDEPAAMRKTAIALGVKSDDITLDDAGFSTYDSCYRAKHVFGLDSAVLVTQNYHLPRAILACEGVGIRSIGYGARATEPLLVAQYTTREFLSTDKIVVQLVTGAKSRFVGDTIVIK